jgi:hypothetical protein
MVDFIFGVSHTQHWHGLNLVQYPKHYSGMRFLGSGAISWLQDKSGAGVYFNPYVEIDGLVGYFPSLIDIDDKIWRGQFRYFMSGFASVGYPLFSRKAPETSISHVFLTENR